MNPATLPTRLMDFLRGRSTPPYGCDAADMGTAFGMEMSFDQPAEAEAAPPTTTQTGWLRRLALRCGATG